MYQNKNHFDISCKFEKTCKFENTRPVAGAHPAVPFAAVSIQNKNNSNKKITSFNLFQQKYIFELATLPCVIHIARDQASRRPKLAGLDNRSHKSISKNSKHILNNTSFRYIFLA
mgnify:CR=1 FL=1